MSKTKVTSPGGLEQQLQDVQGGVQAVLQPTQTYVLAGMSYTGQAIAQMIAAWLAVFAAFTTAKRTEQTALAQRRLIEPAVKAFVGVLHDFIVSQYGAESQVLTQFGFQPKKKAEPLDAEKLVLRKARAKATRQKRGTMGSRQKASIKGQITGSVTVNADGTMSAPKAT